ncbi:MAG TPA: D-arabinono-1,4-lactone oxidase [Acidimicrobiia bacterium]|nr:D-arabinono-1,4-lactone oxidase [Acidimicrobiia bacterium]
MATAPTWSNWVGNQSFTPRAIVPIADEQQVQAEVKRAVAGSYGISTFGAGHSFTPIVETDGVLLDTSQLRGIVEIDSGRRQVTAGPSTTIADFGEPLWEAGLALANQGDIDAQAIAGAIATATHGSGLRHPCMSAMLSGARLVDGHGEVQEIQAGDDPTLLPALQTSIGLLGVMTEVTIEVVPAYELHARTDIMPLDEVLERFWDDVSRYRHFGLFWMPTDASARLYNLKEAGAGDCVVKRYMQYEPGSFDGSLAVNERYGPAYQIYPMVYDPNFHEVEYFLPVEESIEILRAMRQLMLRWLPLSVYPLEIRVVAGDEAWMSPNYQRDNLVVSISGEPGVDYWPYLRACDSLFAEYRGRPHWGKIHFMTADRLERLFPRYTDFVDVRRQFDPQGIFLNRHTRPLFE